MNKPTKFDKKRYKLSESKINPLILKIQYIGLLNVQFISLICVGLSLGLENQTKFYSFLLLYVASSLVINDYNNNSKYELTKQAEDGELLEEL